MDVDMEDETSDALRQDLTCPVCQTIFTDPVTLPCTHSFCRACLQRSWQVNKKCPVCRELFTNDKAVANRVLKNTCETFVAQTKWRSPPKPSEFSCTLHFKPLELFCELDERPVCVDCATLHSTHHLLSVKDGVPLCKSELNDKVEYFERKIESFEKMRQKFIKSAEYIKQQAEEAEDQIKKEFERLHNFLRAEENRRLEALATEKEEKFITMQEKIFQTEGDLKSLHEHVETLKKGLDSEDLPLLMNFQNIKIQTHCIRSLPQFEPNSLLLMSKHVGSLGFNIWKSMKDCVQYYPVVLDPNTASPWLSLTPDLTGIRESPERLAIPDNSERFDPSVFVLGAEGYTSGKHKWEITVGDNPKWIVGVCKKSVARKKMFTVSTTAGVWAIRLSKGVYSALTKEPKELQVNSCPEKVRVKLNMDRGEVSFYDGIAEKHLVSFTFKLEKSEALYPIFGPGLQSTPMTIEPGKVAIHT
uniref:Tripartite motif containing 35-28 n=1 Tax=Neogobius melanostomus TaxID=47308 RepID=A0A8C6TGA3_9GOBI